MTAAGLLQTLRSRGISLWLDDGRPKLSPKEAMTPEDWASLKAVRDDLVALLVEPVASDEIIGGRTCVVYGADNTDLEGNVRQARAMSGVWTDQSEAFVVLGETVARAAPAASGPPVVLPDAKVWLCRADGRECGKGDVCHTWTYEGGPQWWFAGQWPPPGTKATSAEQER